MTRPASGPIRSVVENMPRVAITWQMPPVVQSGAITPRPRHPTLHPGPEPAPCAAPCTASSALPGEAALAEILIRAGQATCSYPRRIPPRHWRLRRFRQAIHIATPVAYCYARHMNAVPARDLRNHTAEILRRVEAGEEIEVFKDNRPIAKLIPLTRRRQWLPATEIASELLRLGADPTGLAQELRETLPETTDDLPW